MDNKLKYFIINLLRKGTYKWPPRTEAFRKAKIERGLYECNICGNIRKSKEVVADHINPVVPIEGFTSFDDYIERMFCESNGFQIICKDICHVIKTKKENEERKNYKLTKSLKSTILKKKNRRRNVTKIKR